MLRAGEPYRDVADTLGASLSSVVRWAQAYRTLKRKGLRARPTPGRPPRLSQEEREHLKQSLLQGAQAAGYTTDLWTLKRIGKLIHTQFGARYTLVGVWKLLRHGLRWTWQKPERRALQRDDKAIGRWRQATWPHIKKRRPPASPSRVPRRKRVPPHP